MSRRLFSEFLISVFSVGMIFFLLADATEANTTGRDEKSRSLVVIAGSGENAGKPIASGSGSTSFSFVLQSGSECQGDSANDNYRIQSFVIPEVVDPFSLKFESTKPSGDGNWALYDVNTRPYVHDLTSIADRPGRPGKIDAIPQLSFAVFPPGTLKPGIYRIGIACSLSNESTRVWETLVNIEDDQSDSPAKLRWEITDGTDSPSNSNSSSVYAVVFVAIVILIAISVVLLARKGKK